MKRTAFLVSLSLFAFSGATNAQKRVAPPEEQLVAVIKQLQEQQALMAENQAKIEVKLATVGEAMRIARIYASRGGK